MAVKYIHLSHELEPEIIGLINRYASVQHLLPSTALKRFLLENLPKHIEEAEACQGKNIKKVNNETNVA